ncbi:MAG: alpha/beta hydrolase fold domain-containing protein [Phycisphaerales bacterium]
MHIHTRCVLHLFIIILIAAALPASAAQVITDLRYESPGSFDNRLDLYLPDGGAQPGMPTILYIHGGSWAFGDKSDQAALHREMADAGYAVVSCNYTLSLHTQPSYPQLIHDVKAVVRWIRTTGVDTYNISPTIVTTGASAGGHLALMLGVTEGVEMFEPLPAPPGGYGIDAVISTYGPADMVALAQYAGVNNPIFVWMFGQGYNQNSAHLYEACSPINYIEAGIPPMAYFHGLNDPVVPVSQAHFIDDAVDALVQPSLLLLYQGQHEIASIGGDAGIAARLKQLIPSLLQNDASDNSPVVDLGLNAGSLVAGLMQDLYADDNELLVLQSQYGFLSSEPNLVRLWTLHHGEDDAESLANVTVTARLNNPGGNATLSIWDFGPERWRRVGTFPLGIAESTTHINDIDAVASIHPTVATSYLELKVVVVATFSTSGFRASIDRVDLAIE